MVRTCNGSTNRIGGRATLLGGNLSVRTAPGEGTRISVTIPLGDA